MTISTFFYRDPFDDIGVFLLQSFDEIVISYSEIWWDCHFLSMIFQWNWYFLSVTFTRNSHALFGFFVKVGVFTAILLQNLFSSANQFTKLNFLRGHLSKFVSSIDKFRDILPWQINKFAARFHNLLTEF